jgi:ubiquitin carboxyl-terminal hydrolase 14
VEDSSVKAKTIGKEAALKEGLDADKSTVFHPWSFESDAGSNNSGYYELQAILTHKGRSSNSGHYVAWTKQKDNLWIECNDDDIRPIHEDDIMKLSGGGHWHTAYLLLYGPRKLPMLEKEEKKEEEEKDGGKKEETPAAMETS